MWSFFIKHDRFSYLLIVALIGFGLYSINSIPKESAPEVQVPIGSVTTILPGAPAADIESLVTNEIERGLSGRLENVKKITSASREGVSVVTVEFEASADIDASIQDLKDEVDTIVPQLPGDAEDPVVSELNFVDQPIMTIAVAGDRTDREFVELGDEIESIIESVSGVARVEKSGIREREVTVVLEQAALERYEIDISQVTNALRQANTTFPVGQIITDDVSYNIAFEGDLVDGSEIGNVVVTVRGGQPVYVRDLGVVEDGLTPATSLARLSVDGEPSETSVSFNVFKRRGGDITVIAQAVNDTLAAEQVDGGLLHGLTVHTVLDAGEDIKDDLINLSRSGLQTIILVILALVVAIGWREGLIAGTAIPLSFMIGFIGLYLSGNTINFISLFALILGIGVLVDSGIVIVEGINKRMKDNPNIDKRQAAIETVQEFSVPLTSGTLTTVSMFVGLFIVSGVTGQFIAAIPFTLVFVLFASLLVALGFLPLIGAGFLRRRSATKMEQLQVQYAHQLEDWYRAKVRPFIEDRKRGRNFILSIMAGFVLAITLIPLELVRVVFFETSDIEFVIIEIELPEGSLKEDTDIAVRRVEEVLYSEPVIESFTSTVGSGNAFASGGTGEKLGNIFVTLREDRDITSTELIERLREKTRDIRDVAVTISQPSNGPPTGAPIGIKLLGDDLTELTDYANQIAILLKEIDGTANVTTSANSNSTEYVVELNKAKAAALGLNAQNISQLLRTAVYGTDATSITTLTDDIDVVVKLNLTITNNPDPADTNRTTIDTIKNLRLSTPAGETVLLSSVANIALRESSNTINHEDQKRTVQVSGDITGDGNVMIINQAILEKIDNELELPNDIEVVLGGETEESNQAFKEMFLALIVGIVLMVGVLVLQFNSFRHTLYVLSILPFSLIGILGGLALTNSPLSFPSLMGFIALSGIVVNNSILLIDQMNSLRKRNPNMEIKEVVIEAAASRLRPILLTTLTTVIGMIPLLYVDPLWVPLATAIMFGLTFSVIITLVLVPVIYSRWPGRAR